MHAKISDDERIYQSALNHLARYATTEAGLARVLTRKIDRWIRLDAAEEAEPEETAAAVRQAKSRISAVIARLRDAGLLNDAAFAFSRARRLTRAGKSRRATLAYLAAKGVAGVAIPDDPDRELAAACAYLRRRRAGPFGDVPELKILAAMARGGFAQDVARHAFRLDRSAAEALIKTLQE